VALVRYYFFVLEVMFIGAGGRGTAGHVGGRRNDRIRLSDRRRAGAGQPSDRKDNDDQNPET